METAPQKGTILLGKYCVEQELGRGGMGVVVAARHVHLQELFAIKMMLPTALEHPEVDAVGRFLREARAASKLKGEHVARVHDVDTLPNGLPYMVMEYLTGQDISRVLDQRGPLPIHDAALYVYQACEAIAEAHSHNIIHRDLKPSNMFLTTRANGTPCVKVLDFGISKEFDQSGKPMHKQTQTGLFIGSACYMPPEQLRDVRIANPRTDIWALGMILYECVTGEVAFVAHAFSELIAKVLADAPVPPSHVRPGIPPQFESIILKCLEKNPEKRFGSVRELMAALHPFTVSSGKQTEMGVQNPISRRSERIQDTTTMVFQRPTDAPPHAKSTIPLDSVAHAKTIPVARASEPGFVNLDAQRPVGGQTASSWGTNAPQGAPSGKKTFVIIGAVASSLAIASVVALVVSRMDGPPSAAAQPPESTVTVATAAPSPVVAPRGNVAEQPATDSAATNTGGTLRIEDLPTVGPAPNSTTKVSIGAKPSPSAKASTTAAQPAPTTTTKRTLKGFDD